MDPHRLIFSRELFELTRLFYFGRHKVTPTAEETKNPGGRGTGEAGNRGRRAIVHGFGGPIQNRGFRLALALLGHRENAEDVTQDIFVFAFRELKTFKDASSFPIWLRKLAIRVCLRYRRLCIIEHEIVEPITSEFLFRTNIDPESEFEKAEFQAMIRNAVSGLPEPFRTVILLYHMDGLSYDEIVQVFGVSVGTVRSHLARGRAILREKLAPLMEEKGKKGKASGASNSLPQITELQKRYSKAR
ncbi:MAG: RNA polymerase sigma factor [Candidatus Fervidibacter sp.]|uniref:RNA polymerase sigma factor n=1 Tax=Candidatus Fervidibacter sp. TaxID=3100871 RepID=UPI004049B74E